MPTVHALIVGINAYAPGGDLPPLRGCAPDALAVRDALTRRLGIDGDHVRTLIDGEATRARLIENWRAHLRDALGPGDVAWFHYSGHGSMAHTLNPAKPSGFDESLVLWDSREPGGSDLRDDELAALIGEVQARGAQLILFLDCCHSGGATRADDDAPAQAAVHIRACPPDRRTPLSEPIVAPAPPAADAAPGPAPIVLAACLDEEKAAEYVTPGGWHGAATWFFLQALAQAQSATTWAQVQEAIAAGVRSRFPRQTPQVSGPADALLLGGAGAPSPPALIVLEVQGERVRIDGGLALGVGPGAQLDLFAPGAAADAAPIARATVDEATADTAWAVVEGGVAVEPATRARLRAYGYDAPVVGVASEEAALRAALAQGTARFVRLAEPEAAALIVRAEEGRYAVTDASGAPLLADVAGVGETEPVLRALEHLAAFGSVRALRNRAISPALRGALLVSELEAVRSSRGRGGGERTPLPRVGGLALARPDQRLHVTIANRSDERLFVALLALGPDYSITRVEPVDGRQTTLGAGRTLELLLRTPPLPPGDEQGMLLLKLCATSVPVSFDALLLPPLRGAPSVVRASPVRDGGPLSWLFDALRRTGTRPVRPLSGDSAEDQWITYEVEILLRRA